MSSQRTSAEEIREQMDPERAHSRDASSSNKTPKAAQNGDDNEGFSGERDFEIPDGISTYTPDCETCDDTGVLQKPTAFQIPEFCDCSTGEDKLRAYERELWRKQRIPEAYWNESLATFKTTQVSDSIEKAYEMTQSFLANLEDMIPKGRGLYFWGENGVGKSHLLTSIINRVARTVPMRPRPLYVQAPKLVLSHKPSSESVFEDHIDPHRNFHETPLLFLDELDDINGTSFEFEIIQDLLKTRYDHQRSTLIASNVEPSQLEEEMKDSISMNGLISRFRSMLLVHGLVGEDKR